MWYEKLFFLNIIRLWEIFELFTSIPNMNVSKGKLIKMNQRNFCGAIFISHLKWFVSSLTCFINLFFVPLTPAVLGSLFQVAMKRTKSIFKGSLYGTADENWIRHLCWIFQQLNVIQRTRVGKLWTETALDTWIWRLKSSCQGLIWRSHYENLEAVIGDNLRKSRITNDLYSSKGTKLKSAKRLRTTAKMSMTQVLHY